MNKIINEVKSYLKNKYNCHSMILYGSFANHTYTDEGDIDIICFCNNINNSNDTSKINGRQLDAWIYDTNKMNKYSELLHINKGKIILDEEGLCNDLLNNIDDYIKNQKKLSIDEINFQKSWLSKMLTRARKADVEGNFRYHWILVDSLEIYFQIKGLYYEGPKKSLIYLENNDIEAYKFFCKALDTKATFEKTEELVEFIISL